MFSPWRTLRLASCVVLGLAVYTQLVVLIEFGFILLMTGIVGGLDLTERRVELLEKIYSQKEKIDAEDETPKDSERGS